MCCGTVAGVAGLNIHQRLNAIWCRRLQGLGGREREKALGGGRWWWWREWVVVNKGSQQIKVEGW